MGKFFVSYSRSNKDDVRKIVDLLKAAKHEVWWDTDIPVASDWWATILEKIEWCEVCIFAISEKSTQSAYCVEELKYAIERQRPILPLVLEPNATTDLPPDFPKRAQWLVYDGDPAKTLSQINDAFDNIDWKLYSDVDIPRPPEPLSGGTSLAKQFQEAWRNANNQEYERAKQLWRNIRSADYAEWGKDCDEWLARINSYILVVDLISDKSTLDRAHAAWRIHKRRYGSEFDPRQIDRLSKRRASKKAKVLAMLVATTAGLAAVLLIVFSLTSSINSGVSTVTIPSISPTVVENVLVAVPSSSPTPTTTKEPTLTSTTSLQPLETATVDIGLIQLESLTLTSTVTVPATETSTDTATPDSAQTATWISTNMTLDAVNTQAVQSTLSAVMATTQAEETRASAPTITPTYSASPTRRPTTQPTVNATSTPTVNWTETVALVIANATIDALRTVSAQSTLLVRTMNAVTTAVTSTPSWTVTLTQTSTSTATQRRSVTSTPTQRCAVEANESGVPIHVGPGTDRSVRQAMPVGESVLVTGQAQDSDGNTWWRLEPLNSSSEEDRFWVSSEAVEEFGSCAEVAGVDGSVTIIGGSAGSGSGAASGDQTTSRDASWQVSSDNQFSVGNFAFISGSNAQTAYVDVFVLSTARPRDGRPHFMITAVGLSDGQAAFTYTTPVAAYANSEVVRKQLIFGCTPGRTISAVQVSIYDSNGTLFSAVYPIAPFVCTDGRVPGT